MRPRSGRLKRHLCTGASRGRLHWIRAMAASHVSQSLRAIAALACLASFAIAQEEEPPVAVRNDVPRAGTEVLVFRHQKLFKGGHEAYFRLSREGVWPWFEKIGSRIVGQWKVIHPGGSGEDADYDHGYRLARYASYDHWKATRQGQRLGGNGPDYQKSRAALRARAHFVAGSDGAYFLRGVTAAAQPYYMPGLDESPPAATPGAVRNDVHWPSREILVWNRWEIAKEAAAEFIEAGVEGVWPYLEKVGVRLVGQWQVIHPPESGFPEDPDHDEVFMLARYAGYEHWKAAQPAKISAMGGDGPDYEAYRAALAKQAELARNGSTTFLEGHLYHSPPKFLPGLPESDR